MHSPVDGTASSYLYIDVNTSWSAVGTDAKCIKDTNEPTMVLNLKSLAHSHQQYLIAHYFGRALGLRYEHQRSDFWKVVQKFVDLEKFSKDPCTDSGEFLSRIDKNLEVQEYDKDSIMHYWYNNRKFYASVWSIII